MKVSDSENSKRLRVVGGTETEPVILTAEQAKLAMKALRKYAEFPFLADHAKQLYESHEALAERVSELEVATKTCIELIENVQTETEEAHQTARLLGQAVFDEARKIVALTQAIAAHQADAARWRARVTGGVVRMPIPMEGKKFGAEQTDRKKDHKRDVTDKSSEKGEESDGNRNSRNGSTDDNPDGPAHGPSEPLS